MSKDVHGVGPYTVVGVGFGEGDDAVPDDKGGRQGQAPALVAVNEGDVDEDGAVVLAERLGDRVRDAEIGGDCGAWVGEDGEGEGVALHGEVVLADELWGDGDQQRTAFAEEREGGLPGFEFGHAVRTPAAAEKGDDQRAKGEEVGGTDELAAGVFEGEGGGWSADGEDRVFDAGGE